MFTRTRGLVVASTVGWLVLVVNAAPPWDPLISNGQAILAACVAVAGTVAMIVIRVQQPAQEVWEQGRAYGRREAVRAAKSHTVSSLAKYRRKRAQRLSRLGAG